MREETQKAHTVFSPAEKQPAKTASKRDAGGENTGEKTAAEKVRTDRLRTLTRLLPVWFSVHKRTLPWRDTGDPYDVWLSEIMLQQTRVEAVKGYFLRFKEALPDIQSLSECGEERLLKLWEGLGYYSRVRNLKKCAAVLMREYGGRLPRDHKALLKLPGIGPYTAGAIASIAYSLPVPAVDGNVLRVYARITGDDSDIALSETKKQVERAFLSVIEEAAAEGGARQKAGGKTAGAKSGRTDEPAQEKALFDPGIFNQALMELGAIVCVPNGAPFCESCPVKDICAARAEGRIERLPVKSGKKPRKIEERTVLILQDGDRFLLQKRPERGLLAGLYEFPALSGFRTENEVLSEIAALGLDAVQIKRLPDAKHIFTHVEWRMRGYLLKLAAESRVDEALANAGWLRPHRFVTREETEAEYALPSAFSAFAKALFIEQGAKKTKSGAENR